MCVFKVAGTTSEEYTEELVQLMTDEWELEPKDIKLGSIIGQGAFGKVMTGLYQDVHTVAVKVLKGGYTVDFFMQILG